MRASRIWISERCETLLTHQRQVALVDRFLTVQCVPLENLQLLGMACFLIAKCEAVACLRVAMAHRTPCVTSKTMTRFEFMKPNRLVYFSDDTYTRKELLDMEFTVLRALDFKLRTPTALDYKDRFLKAAHVIDLDEPELFAVRACVRSCDSMKALNRSQYFLHLTLLNFEFNRFRASHVAAAALLAARELIAGYIDDAQRWVRPARPQANTHLLMGTQTPDLVYYTGYCREVLRECANAVHKTHRTFTDHIKIKDLQSFFAEDARRRVSERIAPRDTVEKGS